MDLALALTGWVRGGPAKAAVVASAMLGSISGSPSGNAATTGVFTIPMTKKIGHTSAFAAGVEAVASTGGMILPPVMGAIAFVYNPALVLRGPIGAIMLATATAFIGACLVAAATRGYLFSPLNVVQGIGIFVAGLLWITPGLAFPAACLVLAAVALIPDLMRLNRGRGSTRAPA